MTVISILRIADPASIHQTAFALKSVAALAVDLFGSKYVGGIYGWILLGWGFAAVPSPLLIA